METIIAAIGSISAAVAALVAVLDYRSKRRGREVPAKRDSVGSRRVLRSIGLGVAIWLGLSILGSVAAFGISYLTDENGTTTPTTVIPATTRPTSTTVAASRIEVTSPPKKRPFHKTGPTVAVAGSGTVPTGKHLWVFVYAPDVHIYYPDNEVITGPDYWESPSEATLGGEAAGDINALYTIYAVLVDDSVNDKLNSFLQKYQGDKGYEHLPAGMKAVDSVTVRRIH